MAAIYPDPSVLAALGGTDAHPHDPSAADGITAIQTHLSHVFLTRDRVYKFRKPVDLDFVCFATREERDADCLREVALNRRLAPDVYLGVAPLRIEADAVTIGPPAEALSGSGEEHCVVMRRLPEGRDALSLLEQGRLSTAQLDRLAGVVARFHAAHGLGRPAPFSPDAWHACCTDPMTESLSLLAGSALASDVAPLLAEARERCESFVSHHADRFEWRRTTGRAVDAHGDLHLQHAWYETDDGAPIVIDCLEFSERLRHIDTAAEVAFPAMDLAYRGHRDLAERFLRVYAREADDFDLYGVVDYFASYRAAVRAKVAAIAAADRGISPTQRAGAAESAKRHLEHASAWLTPREPGALVLVGGVVGTGKSTVAAALADAFGPGPCAAVVTADRVRKRLAGLDPTAHSHDRIEEGLYAPAFTQRVYAGLLERARPVLASGRIAILDATWSRRDARERARAVAVAAGARCVVVEARCASEVVLERLARRAAAASDPSDAGPDFYETSRARYEALADDESGEMHHVATDRPDWPDVVRRIAAGLVLRG